MKSAIIKVLCFSLVALLPTAAAACPKPSYSAAQHNPIPTRNINQRLFSDALRKEASYARCKQGYSKLKTANGLTGIASSHSKWMAKASKLSHTSSVPGQKKFSLRIKISGVKFRSAAENIARFNRYQLGTTAFKIISKSGCKFASSSGQEIAAHTYASMAQTVVAGWMGSSGHRKNLLIRRIKYTGGGIGFDPSGDFCGHFYITQDYAG